jgi:serine/threonine protein kinase
MIGRTLSHFKITAKLGKGGMGEVFVAEDTNLKRRVALKVLPAELAGSQERLERFQREAESLAALNHPNIVHVYSVETDQQVHFLTMELVEGESLEQLIPEQGLPLEQVFDLAIPVADALAEAHDRGIVHRDLKPANVMVDGRGTPKILDFGLAKLTQLESDGDLSSLSTAAMTQQGVVLGTFPYMSPEQVQGRRVDQRTDLFSFGAVLYEMITGRRAFEGTSSAAIAGALVRDTPAPPRDSHPRLPRAFLDLLDRCLEKDPETRVQTAAEVRDRLQDIRTGTASTSRRPLSVWFRDHLWRTWGQRALLGAVAVAILTLAYVGLGRRETAPEDASSPQQSASGSPAAELSPADAAIVRGRYYTGRYSVTPRPEDFDLAMAEFQDAFALEPDRAEIPARIAALYAQKMQSGGEIARLIPEVELWALRAMELDSDSSLAWNALYNAERYRLRPNHRKLLETAFRSFRLTSHEIPNPQAISFYSVHLGLEGYRYGLQLYPLSPFGHVNPAVNLSMLGRHDESLELVDEALRIDLDFTIAKAYRASFLVRLDRFEEARGLIADLPPMPDVFQVVVTQTEFFMVLATGDANAVREGLPTQIAILLNPELAFTFRWPYLVPPFIEALAANGYVEEALDVMSQLHEAGLGDPPYDWLRLSPLFDPIREDPRFQAVEAHAKENFDLMLEHLDRFREDGNWPAELEQARLDLLEQLGD